MRVVLPGGSGQIGRVLARHLSRAGHEVVVLSRGSEQSAAAAAWRTVLWNARTLEPAWVDEIGAADAIVNLCGRTVNCRYTPRNREAILSSRVVSTRVVGEAIAAASRPPRVWLNASTSTIYRHALDRDQDEFTGEPARWTDGPPTTEKSGLPETWSFSAGVGRQWERTLREAQTPGTAKVALRTSMVMRPDTGGVFRVLSGLVRAGLGGTQGPGTQYVSWMHDVDFARAVELLLEQPEIAEASDGVVNMTAPQPTPNRAFMRALRESWRVPLGLPATRWMLEIGAVSLRTESELVLKSRRVVPGVLARNGFAFHFPEWSEAARDLVRRTREHGRR